MTSIKEFLQPALPLLLGVAAAVSLLLLAVMGVDKRRARLHRWRVPEKVLFLLALCGGGAGGLLGMLLFRHKTRKPAFVLGFPAIFLVQAALLFWLYR
ncbi:MAG: DUF1294 domain-containing protein [Clostridia bacterium]|nr:DUF1294 domain-containing protein [Clostridia bacterium]